jgi:CheY-like chemotaxis protein
VNDVPSRQDATANAARELAQLLHQVDATNAELTRLQRDVAEAQDHLDQAEQLREVNEQLVLTSLRAISDTESARLELREVAQAAEIEVLTRASQNKSEFLSRVSHELRTPLNAILGFGQLLLMDDDTRGGLSSLQRDRVEAMQLAGKRLLSLTNDMLDLARIEKGSGRTDVKTDKPVIIRRTVLYVEDNPVNAMLMRQLFVAEPAWSLLIATTGQMGIDLAMSRRPTLVLLDMHLPDMTGLQVLEALREKNILPPKGCICLSADALPEHVSNALAAGFSQYWTKPFDLRQTMQQLRELLAADT